LNGNLSADPFCSFPCLSFSDFLSWLWSKGCWRR